MRLNWRVALKRACADRGLLMSAISDNAKAVIIGVVSALLVTLMKDVIINEPRRFKESKKPSFYAD